MPPPAGVGSPSGNPLSALEMTRLALFKMYNQQAAAASGGGGAGPLGPGGPGGTPPLDVGRAMAEQQARAALAAAAARGENDNKENAAVGVNHQGHRRHGPLDNNLDISDDAAPVSSPAAVEVGAVAADKMAMPHDEASCSPPPMKRERRVSRASDERRRNNARSPVGNSGGGANIRISSRGNDEFRS